MNAILTTALTTAVVYRLLLIAGLLSDIPPRARIRLLAVPRNGGTHHVLVGRRAACSGDCSRVILCHGAVVWALEIPGLQALEKADRWHAFFKTRVF